MDGDTATTIPARPHARGSAPAAGQNLSTTSSDEASTQMARDLRSWGVSLILLGVLHFVLAGFLEPTWGIVLAILGILNLLVRKRGMFIANGVALGVVGLMNIFSGGVGGWTLFGVLQLYWGAREIRKYRKYEQSDPASKPRVASKCSHD